MVHAGVVHFPLRVSERACSHNNQLGGPERSANLRLGAPVGIESRGTTWSTLQKPDLLPDAAWQSHTAANFLDGVGRSGAVSARAVRRRSGTHTRRAKQPCKATARVIDWHEKVTICAHRALARALLAWEDTDMR